MVMISSTSRKLSCEAEVEPHSVADDLRGETMAAVERSSSVHQPIMPQVLILRHTQIVKLTIPYSYLIATIGSTFVARLPGM